MDRLPFYGATTACVDNELLRGVLGRVRRKVYTYGESADADFRLQVLAKDSESHSLFEVSYKGLVLGKFRLHVPGRHNVLNATAAVAVGVQLGVAPDQIAVGLESFRGVDRRFQIKGVVHGVTVVDDYGHHPTEILATLRAARECGFGRVHVLFQPHRFTRTRDLMTEFAGAFKDADTVEVLDIYAASEEPIAGVNSQALVKAMRGVNGGAVAFAASVPEAVEVLVKRAGAGDAILTLGAGSVSQAGAMLLEALEANG
jgi:UDP-N-acetylmuramate--alanine ligase